MRKESQLNQMSFFSFLAITATSLSLNGCNSNDTSSNNLASSPQQIQVQSENSSLELLTRGVLDENTHRSAAFSTSDQMESKAKSRRDALLAIVAKDPSAVLRVAFSQAIRNSMDASTRDYIEEHLVDVRGTLLVLEKMSLTGETVLENHFRTDDGKTYILHLVDPLEHTLTTGAKILVKKGTRIPVEAGSIEPLVAERAEPLTAALTTSKVLPNTLGPQKAIIFLLNFQDQPDSRPWTKEQVRAEVVDKFNNYLDEASYHQASMTADIVDWKTIAINSNAGCDASQTAISNAAAAIATQSGINLSSYTRRIYMFPKMTPCVWAGLAWIGTWNGYGENWINGYNNLLVTGHELGHSYGLYHANTYNCGTSPISASCTVQSYADPTDLMGNRAPGHFNAFHKEQLGWLDFGVSPPIKTVTASGVYTIDPLETTTANPKALKILKGPNSTGGNDYYYVEYRQSIGFDQVINGTGNLFNGVVVHVGNDTKRDSSHMLNMTPSVSSFLSGAISGNFVFQDPNAVGGGISIALNSLTSSGAAVSVTIGGAAPTCVRANPTLTVSPSTAQWVNAGSGAAYALTLRNNDSSSCAASTFNLNVSPSSGVTANVASPSLTLSPGATSSVNLQVNSSVGTLNGVYPVTVQAANNGAPSFLGTATASLGVQQVQAICVRANPSVSVSPATTQWVSPGGGATYVFTVKNNDSSSCAAGTFNLSTTPPAFGVHVTLYASTITLAPGASSSVNLQLSAGTTTAAGSYYVTLIVKNSAATNYYGAANVGLGVKAASSLLNVTVNTDKPVYIRSANQAVRAVFTMKALYNGVAASNAPLSVTMRYPNGTLQTLHLTADSQGSRWFFQDYTLRSQAGSYILTITATYNGITSSGQAVAVVQ